MRNADQMTCETPYFELPDAFKDWEDNKEAKQQKPQGDSNNVTETMGEESLAFFLGFQLDGVNKYKNLSKTPEMKKYAQITVHTVLPRLVLGTGDSDSARTFVPFSNEPIRFKVSLGLSHIG